MTTYEIRGMHHNAYDNADPFRPDALYMYEISIFREEPTLRSGTDYKSVKLLMEHFNVHNPSELIGKMFEVPNDDDAEYALQRLLLNIQNEGKYTPPSDTQLLFRAVNSLALMTCPDFSNVDSQTVYTFFATAFRGFVLDRVWFDRFEALLAEHSAGEVRILNGNSEDFRMRVKGPAAYFKLIRGTTEINFVFGPYSTPFVFQNDPE